ncbi:Nucleosome assembly protein (NAP) [Cynara cardunculus var. scolymus]|uniref:Nucleosome assembly protein (NAP) n=1 Tax=Cynara cardunculus var. scolymus TaxID=59895 RepID=A0A103T1P8_CYNCS|nr:Nucleosome assembly protein (NAP) [Cynara cardunculus var. scolymus]
MSANQEDQFNMTDLSSTLPAATAALSAEDRAGLVNALKSKLDDLTGQHPDFLDTLSANARQRVGVLKDLQNQHDELEAKYIEERAELEAKYLKLYEPLYAKRYEIVNGLTEVEGVLKDTLVDKENNELAGDKGVPNFWLTAMKSNEVLADEISESDEGALQYLKDVKWCRVTGAKGFKLELFFDPNPYFKNSVLTKTYEMINEEEHILEKAIGYYVLLFNPNFLEICISSSLVLVVIPKFLLHYPCLTSDLSWKNYRTVIEWFPGKNLTQKVLRKKPKKGSRSPKPPITKTEDCESFFNFFNPPQIPDDEEDIDEDIAELLQSQMEHDYDIGSTIRDKIIPHAVSWFTGEAAQNDEYEIEDDEDDEDADEDDEDAEEDEDDDEDNVNNKKK